MKNSMSAPPSSPPQRLNLVVNRKNAASSSSVPNDAAPSTPNPAGTLACSSNSPVLNGSSTFQAPATRKMRPSRIPEVSPALFFQELVRASGRSVAETTCEVISFNSKPKDFFLGSHQPRPKMAVFNMAGSESCRYNSAREKSSGVAEHAEQQRHLDKTVRSFMDCKCNPRLKEQPYETHAAPL